MSDRWNTVGRILKSAATQAGALAVIVAIDQTVRSWVNHKFKQYTTKRKEDAAIEVKPADPKPEVKPELPPKVEITQEPIPFIGPLEVKPTLEETPSAS